MNVIVVVVALQWLTPAAFNPPSEAQVGAGLKTPLPASSKVTPPKTPASMPLPSPYAQRLVAVTKSFLNAPYTHSPLGEGDAGGPDTDPRLRFDAFDCTTFVESALALSLSSSLPEAATILDHIRYRKGQVSYAERRHFPEAEWIPELIAAGLLHDITESVGGADVVIATKKLNNAVWEKARHKGLPALPDGRIPDGVFSLPVWPLDKALAHPERIPAGTVLNLVRDDFASVPVRVSHQGIVLDVDGVKVIRHAADRMHHRVVDEPLGRFFARMSHYKKWPVTGVHLVRFDPDDDWRVRLGMGLSPSTTSLPTVVDEPSISAGPPR